MERLSKLNRKQLEKRLVDTQAELKRRELMSKAVQEISKILEKYNLTLSDIDLEQLSLKSKSNSKTKVDIARLNQKKTRAKVPPKFKSPDGSQKWTGRGRTPRWVVKLCEAENITIDMFKQNSRFKL